MTCGPKDTHIKKTVKIGFIHEVLASRAVQTPDSTVHSRPKKHNSCIKNAGFHLSSPPNQTIKCYRSTVVNAHTVHEHSSNEWMCTRQVSHAVEACLWPYREATQRRAPPSALCVRIRALHAYADAMAARTGIPHLTGSNLKQRRASWPAKVLETWPPQPPLPKYCIEDGSTSRAGRC
jgi:hypothetical protein